MQAASFEATFPIMGGLVWSKTFHAMYATPISPRDIALGNMAWQIARLTLICSIFTLVIILFGAAESPLIVLAIPAAVLTGMAFATPISAFAATQKTPRPFRRDLPLRDHPAVPLLGHVLPDQLVAGRAPGAGLADAALPWGGPDPRPLARHAVRRSRGGADPRHVPGVLALVGGWLMIRNISRTLVRG